MINSVYPAENIHPSQLPENRSRVELHNAFFNKMIPQISQCLGLETYIPPSGYEQAWVIFLGSKSDDQMDFVCHITENQETMQAYNSVDSTQPLYPVLLYGQSFYIQTSIMDQMRARFPSHHQGSVPAQMTLTISCRDNPGHQDSIGGVQGLLDGGIDAFQTADFTVSLIEPTGVESLSFTVPDSPIEFWTHASRAPAIFAALEKEELLAEPNADRVMIYQAACDLETVLMEAESNFRNLQKRLIKKEEQVGAADRSLNGIINNDRIPPDIKKQRIVEKEEAFETQKAELIALQNREEPHVQTINTAVQAIEQFKETYFDTLPNSYREATFQIGFDMTLPDGSVVYKRYNGETNQFLLSENPAREIRYRNDVHNPYIGT